MIINEKFNELENLEYKGKDKQKDNQKNKKIRK